MMIVQTFSGVEGRAQWLVAFTAKAATGKAVDPLANMNMNMNMNMPTP
jgi:hypothetical protein